MIQVGVLFFFWVAVHSRVWAEPQAGSSDSGSALRKTTWRAQILRGRESQIQGLTFVESTIPVVLVLKEEVLRPAVELVGYYSRPGWRLVAQGYSLLGKMPDETEFKFFTYLNSALNQLTLVAWGPSDQKEEEQVMILSPEAKEFRISPPWGESVISLGAGSFSYFQSDYGYFSSLPLLLHVNYSTPRWKLPVGIYTALQSTILTTQSNPKDLSPQIVSGNLDLTYRFRPKLSSPYRWNVLAGGSYLTLISNASPFGFANLLAFEFGAFVDYVISTESSWVARLHYSPLGSLTDFSQHGIQFRLGWTTTLSNFHRIELLISLLNYHFLQSDQVTKVQSNIWGLTLGYAL